MTESAASLSFYGKLPTHGDFIRVNGGGAALRALDAWLQQGLFRAKMRDRRGFAGRFAAMPLTRFVFTPDGPAGALLGVMTPSRDRVGRPFPFLAWTTPAADVQGVDLARTPAVWAGFYDVAASVVRRVEAGALDVQELDAHTRLPAPVGEAAAHDAYLRETTLDAFRTRLGSASGRDSVDRVFANLLDILLPLRDGVPAAFRLALQFPLGPDAAAAPAHAGFWLELCARVLRPAVFRATYFWTVPRADGLETGPEPGRLLLFLRPPRASAFPYVYEEGPDGDTLCVLDTMGAAATPPAVPGPYRDLFTAGRSSLHDVLRRL